MKYSINSIFQYPIKGCSGMTTFSALPLEQGMSFDRRYLLIDEDNRFITQREFPILSTIKLEVRDRFLKVIAGTKDLMIKWGEHAEEEVEVQVWDDKFDAFRTHDDIDSYFTNILDTPVRLVYCDDKSKRIKKLKEGRQTKVSFADGYPYNIVGTASVDQLNQKKNTSFNVDRFRPNIYVNTEVPHEEDNWRKVQIGEAVFEIIKPCYRCQVINIDQQTGEKSLEPTKTLAEYRMFDKKLAFGVQAICLTPGIEIVVDSEIHIL